MNCRIVGNSSRSGCGGISECDGDIINCVIAGNSSSSMSGGLDYCTSRIEWCEISGNSTFIGHGGGLGFCSGDISHCIIEGNSAMVGGGVAGNWEQTSGSLTDCIIAGNTGGPGGGVASFYGAINNCLVIGNMTDYGDGGGLHYCGGPIVNCTIAGNSAVKDGAGTNTCGSLSNCIVWGNTGLSQIKNTDASHSCLPERADLGQGNISDDPLFTTGPLGTHYLSCIDAGQAANSPCINAGHGTSESLGLDKLTTRTDGGFDVGVADMGYHYPVYDVKIETSLNDDEFCPGQQIDALLSLQNDGSEIMANVYVALILPDGSVLCFGPDGGDWGIFPYAQGVPVKHGFSVGPFKAFSAPIPEDTPPGTYTYASVLTVAAGSDYAAVSSSPFVIN